MLELWISIGRHRKEKNWKNQKYTWAELLDRFKKVQYTGETVREYAEMAPDQQAVIKDVGGFVGGAITGGRRKKGAVTSRCLITLDADFAPPDLWDQVTLDFTCAMAVYSTHKHTPQVPRLRLIIPLDREVLTDEYEAISRKIAADIGLDYFDPTTFQSERLMYWPSMPSDGKYFYADQAGPALCADSVLARYKDWKDSSQWPVHPGEARQVREGLQAAQDPTEKTGIVGAFCRAYGIERAISELLSDEYTPAGEGRYTYTGGSTAAGLVVYDDKFAYSHHGTDPAGGQLCNSFDLVRLHKYGKADYRIQEDTPITRRPSFIAMADLARAQPEVNLDLVKQQTGKAQEAFKDIEEAGDLDGWLETLQTDKKGKIEPTAENIMIILRNDPLIKGRLWLNEFSYQYRVSGALPWNDSHIERNWADEDDAGLRWYIETTYNVTAIKKIEDCLSLIMKENGAHPVQEYLSGLVWDGKERLDTLLIDYLGAPDNLYTRTVTRKALVAAVYRAMEPGCKFDNVLVLVGPQGSAKSELISVLGGEWYSENFGRLDNNQAMENLQGAWIMEIAEMAALKRSEVEVIKHFISKRRDEFRPAYGRRKASFPRGNTFWGTSNDFEIQDNTGGRRWWPVTVIKSLENKRKIFNVLPKERAQIWAEAVRAWSNSEALHLTESVELMAEEVQESHADKDPWLAIIREYLETDVPANWGELGLYDRRNFLNGDETQAAGKVPRTQVTAKEIWLECLGGDRKGFTSGVGKRIAHAMQKIRGWQLTEKKIKIEGNAVRVYVKGVAAK